MHSSPDELISKSVHNIMIIIYKLKVKIGEDTNRHPY